MFKAISHLIVSLPLHTSSLCVTSNIADTKLIESQNAITPVRVSLIHSVNYTRPNWSMACTQRRDEQIYLYTPTQLMQKCRHVQVYYHVLVKRSHLRKT